MQPTRRHACTCTLSICACAAEYYSKGICSSSAPTDRLPANAWAPFNFTVTPVDVLRVTVYINQEGSTNASVVNNLTMLQRTTRCPRPILSAGIPVCVVSARARVRACASVGRWAHLILLRSIDEHAEHLGVPQSTCTTRAEVITERLHGSECASEAYGSVHKACAFVYGVRSVPIAHMHHAAWCAHACGVRRCQHFAVRAVPYITGAAGSNACPTGSTRIDDPTACQNAAVAVAATFSLVESADRPKGCYSQSFATGIYVFLNKHATGKGAAGYTPLCAGALPLRCASAVLQ